MCNRKSENLLTCMRKSNMFGAVYGKICQKSKPFGIYALSSTKKTKQQKRHRQKIEKENTPTLQMELN